MISRQKIHFIDLLRMHIANVEPLTSNKFEEVLELTLQHSNKLYCQKFHLSECQLLCT